eukprot:gene10529-11666_t
MSTVGSLSTFRFLEGNSFQLHLHPADPLTATGTGTVAGAGALRLLVDPVFSTLDFGLPLLYQGRKKALSGQNDFLSGIVRETDLVVITQGIDDHAHKPTLEHIHRLSPTMRYLIPPSAKAILTAVGIPSEQMTILRHGDQWTSAKVEGVAIEALPGALLGPPWQTRENGYLFCAKSAASGRDVNTYYYEPHGCDETLLALVSRQLAKRKVDAVIAPIVSQRLALGGSWLPSYPLVFGAEEAVHLVKTVQADYLLPLDNGNLDQEGLLAGMLQQDEEEVLRDRGIGKVKKLLTQQGRQCVVLDIQPGQWLPLPDSRASTKRP